MTQKQSELRLSQVLWPSWPRANERHIAGRYLYRARSPRTLLSVPGVVALVLLLVAVAAVGNYFLVPGHQTPLYGALAILGPLCFVSAFLLNLFSVFSTVAVIGVVLGVAALTVVLAVTSGFQAEIKDRVIGVNAHILVLKYGIDFREYADVLKKVQEDPRVVAAAPFVFNEMLIAREGGAQNLGASGVLVKGIEVRLAGRVIDIGSRLLPLKSGARPTLAALQTEPVDSAEQRGAPSTDSAEQRGAPSIGDAPAAGDATKDRPALPGLFVGQELARKLKVEVGSRVRLIAPLLSLDGLLPEAASDDRAAQPPRSQEFRVAGIFAAGFDEYDRRLVYVALPQAQGLVGQGDTVTGVEVRTRDADLAPRVAKALEDRLGGGPYRTLDWEQLNHNLFQALFMQKIVLGVVLALIILVAAFNIVASLTMMVVDKTREVAILKAMGMSASSVGAVFRTAGMTIGLYGTGMGLLMGFLVCAAVGRLGYLLDAKVYLIDRLPIQISPVEVVVTAAVTMLVCWLATLYPTLRAARMPPVDGLRNE